MPRYPELNQSIILYILVGRGQRWRGWRPVRRRYCRSRVLLAASVPTTATQESSSCSSYRAGV